MSVMLLYFKTLHGSHFKSLNSNTQIQNQNEFHTQEKIQSHKHWMELIERFGKYSSSIRRLVYVHTIIHSELRRLNINKALSS